MRTPLGWGIVGPVSTGGNGRKVCLKVTVSEVTCHFANRTHVKEVSPEQINQMFDRDFSDPPTEELYSWQDKKFLRIAKDGISLNDKGHCEMPLPFKSEQVKLPNNKAMAATRLRKLRVKLQKDSAYRGDYTAFMQDVIAKGHAEKVPIDELCRNDGTVWYLPHFGVYHPKKPNKIRVVFDCSAEFKEEILNQQLLQGPDLTNNMVGVLCRFRKERVAFMCDIEGMFHQVRVNPEHRNYLRFLWYDEGDLEQEPQEYRMCCHLFGATSSPGCANFALKYVADLYREHCGSKASEFLKNDFYVDDGIKSVPTVEEAIQLIHDTRELCQKGGFHLHKFVANDRKVLYAIPMEQRAKEYQKINFAEQELPIERTLGVEWCVETDNFQFRISLKDAPLTRRGILSTVSSIFDPLGLLAPFILTGRNVLKQLCQDGRDWDEPVPDLIRSEWEAWRAGLQDLSAIKVGRAYKPENFGEVVVAELHHFSDASMDGLGQCSYLRLVDSQERVFVSLAMGKAKVTPTKSVTMPRLELCAAVMSAKVSHFLQRELQYEQLQQVFYTDSKVVLGYISNESKRFHVFVANRVEKIREYTTPPQWRHIDTMQNPADLASRGLTAKDLKENQLWWKGPQFLGEKSLPNSSEMLINLSSTDPEVKRTVVLNTYTSEGISHDILKKLECLSSWDKALRRIAYWIILKETLIKKAKGEEIGGVNLSVEKLQQASINVIRLVQAEVFNQELETLKAQTIDSRRTVAQTSSIHSQEPYLDGDGLIRVGGRLKGTTLPKNLKHPVILPRRGHISGLIIKHYHERCGHGGRNLTLNAVRQAGFWIVHSRAAVTSQIFHCITCRKLRGNTCGQKMADLPECRTEDAPPFTYSGVDYFGPFYIKEGRKEMKRWGVLFTCLASRAIHLETANTLSADSFINAYRRFVCRRGPIRELHSDRGTNFIGGKTDLDKSLEEMNHSKVKEVLLKENCDYIRFVFNVPLASHMGGAWERMIRSARAALNALLQGHPHHLDDELLRTLLTEAEAIVNSRPLTYMDTNSSELLPLSPNQILTLKTEVVLPPAGHFSKEDLYCRRRWRRVQHLANEFWKRWKVEFLASQQERKKWVNPEKNLKKDDVVLMVEDDTSRNQWPLARVVDTYPGSDGRVRKVRIRLGNGREYDRPVHKLVLLIAGTSPPSNP